MPAPNNKDVISHKLDKSNYKIELLAAMVLFKYFRQSNINDRIKQEQLLFHISVLANKAEIDFRDLMMYMKNDGYFVQRKLPTHLKNSLENMTDIGYKFLTDWSGHFDLVDTEDIKKFMSENINRVKVVDELTDSDSRFEEGSCSL